MKKGICVKDLHTNILDQIKETKHSKKEKIIEQLKEKGLPVNAWEEWKYTNISNIINTEYKDFQDEEEIDKIDDGGILGVKIVFINGFFSKKFSVAKDEMPEGLSIEEVEEEIKEEEIKSRDTFFLLNEVLTPQRIQIKIKKGFKIKEKIHIISIVKSIEARLIYPSYTIQVEEQAKATIIQEYRGRDQKYFVITQSKICIEKQAELDVYQIQDESLKAYHMNYIDYYQEEESKLKHFNLLLGGEIARQNLRVFLKGERIDSKIQTIYSLLEGQHIDNQTYIQHQYPNCESYQLYKGILQDKSRVVFSGRIKVYAEAQETNAYQLNKNLLLGKGSRVDTQPQLEIFADNVKCSHGATVGQLDKESIIYLQSRNISREEAVRMLLKGF